MVLYKRLLARNMVSPFYVKTKKLGITGDSKHITIGDSTVRITDMPNLRKGSKLWKSVAVK